MSLISKDILNKDISNQAFVPKKGEISPPLDWHNKKADQFLRNEKLVVLTPTQCTVAVYGNNRLKTMA